MDSHLREIIQDTLQHLQELAKTTPSVLAKREEKAYFAPRPSRPKKEFLARVAPPIPITVKENTPKEMDRPAPPKKQDAPAREESKPLPSITSNPKKLMSEMRQAIEKTLPTLALRETIPDDARAKKMSNLWEETYLNAQIIIISFGEVGAGLQFLKNVTHAIDTLIAPAQLVDGFQIEKENGWDLLLNSPSLKSVLASPWAGWKSTSLTKHFKQNGVTQEQFLGPHKLLLLEPSLHYLKDPDRKRKLWQLINTQLLS